MRLRGPQCSFGSGDESEHAEDLAKAELQRVQVSVLDATAKSQQALLELQAALDEVEDNLSRIAGDKGIFAYKNQQSQGENKSTMGGVRHPVESTALSGTVGVPLPTGAVLKLDFEVKKLSFKGNTPEAIKTRKMLREASDFINQFYFIDRDKFQQLLRAQELIRKAADEDGPMELGEADFETLKQILSSLLDTVKASAANARNQLRTILTLLTEERPEIAKVVVRYRTFRDEMKAVLREAARLVTLNRIPANRLPGGGDPLAPTPMVYQLAASRLQLDHCFLSRVAVSLSADGSYEISFRADQNPVASNDPGSPLRPSDAQPAWTLQTAQLLRNQFIVKVRGYAAYPLPSTPPNLAPGKPVLVEFPIEPFWVERGKPYSGFVTGVASDALRKKFEFIDRIEVEFTYR